MALGLLVVVEHIVNHEVKAGAQVGHIATEGLVGIYRNLETINVHTVVRLKELLNIGILISLYLSRWEALLAEVLKGLIANSVQSLWGMTFNHACSLLVEFYILLFACHYSSPISSLIQS